MRLPFGLAGAMYVLHVDEVTMRFQIVKVSQNVKACLENALIERSLAMAGSLLGRCPTVSHRDSGCAKLKDARQHLMGCDFINESM